MKPERKEFIQNEFKSSDEWKEVKRLSNKLYKFLSDPTTSNEIDLVNQSGVSSHKIQDIILNISEKIGFSSEKKGLFSTYEIQNLDQTSIRKFLIQE